MKVKAIYLRAGVDVRLAVVFIQNDGSDLDQIYKLLDCDAIDVTYRQFADKTYCVICDDNGKLKSNPLTSAITIRTNQPIRTDLVGNLLITGYPDNEGNFSYLSEADIKNILSSYISLVLETDDIKTNCYVFRT